MEIRVLGETWGMGSRGERVRLERKTAALLAYLALEGPATRSLLVRLLWPDSHDPVARNNLRQVLSRLRRQLGVECVEGSESLKLSEGLTMDVLHLRAALKTGNDTQAALFDRELLEGVPYKKCEELNAWLDRWRLELREKWLKAMEREVLRLEREGQLASALDGARRMLARDHTSETAYQLLMRLHYVLGNRTAALEAYRQCQRMLQTEFGVEPLPETSALARAIERSAATRQQPAPTPRRALPLSVGHPPVLAGRERVWALMEEAWAARKPMFVDGVAGIGKTRLVTQFAQARGKSAILINARPGDRDGGEFHTHMRSLSRVLDERPEAEPRGWVRRELSRLVPRLETRPLPPPSNSRERARLFSAVIEFLGKALRGVDFLIFDDGHYMDQASAELGIQVHAEFREETAAGRFPLIINVYRTSEVRDDWERQLVQSVLSSGLMHHVPVERLDAEAVRVMLRGMGEPLLEQLSEEITAYTGGNPFFIVETVRHLLQSGTFDGTFPASLPPPGRVGPIIEHRLKLLSKEALELARVFAVARTDFSVEMAAFVLEVPVGQLTKPWEELEAADIIEDLWFSHDVVGEVILSALPEAVRKALEARIAEYRRRHR